MAAPRLEGVFGRPFAQQLAAFRLRLGNLVPTARWDDILKNQHDRAFMVAGAAKADLLADLAAAVDKAIAQGTGLDAFERDFREIVERNGWHGWTGEGTRKGEAWRMKTIYRTNMATSYHAGRLAQLRAAGFKYWVYRHGGSREPREHHLALDGLILPADHEFWLYWYPPNDWGCSCYVVGAATRSIAGRLGGKPGVKLPPDWKSIDPRTGAVKGIGTGWDYQPGATTEAEIRTIASKPPAWEFEIARAFFDALPRERADEISRAMRRLPSTSDALAKYARKVEAGKTVDGARSLGLLPDEVARQISRLLGRDVSGHSVQISADAIRHALAGHADLGREALRGQAPISTETFRRLVGVIDAPGEIRLGRLDDQAPRIVVDTPVSGGVLRTVWELGGRRRRWLRLVTMYFVAG